MKLLYIFAALSLLLGALIFGFFYAWICSTMWGLDAIDPNVAIAAMQGMNASVRNGVFAPAFFGTPFVMLATAALAARHSLRAVMVAFGLAGLVYLFGGMVLTMAVNVPMNEALAEVALPLPEAQARAVWADYSPRWQMFNVIRTGFSGLSLALAGLGVFALGRAAAQRVSRRG